MWSWQSQKLESSLSVEVNFLDLCKHNVRSIEDLVNGGNLLNHRQCLDLSTKLSKTTLNIRELILNCGGASFLLFRPALENLYRYLEKAKLLVNQCGEEDWCAAAVFQIQNENAFREILLDVGLCYNAIYEQAISTSKEWNFHTEDLRQSSMFEPATASDVLLDQQNLHKRLEDLANEPRNVNLLDHFLPRKGALKQCLARYLLVKLNYTYGQAQPNTLDTCSVILWSKETEPSGTWGSCRLLGAGSGASGVCSTKWLGIPCAKKEFHALEAESFFLKEAGILAHLKHPCIVNFFCCGNGQERGDRFIAMELMEKSLFNLIEEHKDVPFSLPVVIDMMVQIARGMCYLHDQGVAHRDLKPQNVVVNRLTSPHLLDHFCVKLVDFEMSKTKVQISKSNTISARGVGTTTYRAPEVHPKAYPNGEGKAVWFNADVYSFAITCAHLLSLKTPFGDTKLNESYKELKKGRRPELPCDCPQELVTLLRDCWNTTPRSRPSFLEVCTRLETLRHKFLRGFSTSPDQCLQAEKVDLSKGFDFIQMKIKEQSSIARPFLDDTDDEVEGDTIESDEINGNGVVSIIPCTCGRALELLPQSLYNSTGSFWCNICEVSSDGEVYHCETCEFDAHPDCAEIKDKVKVFFHNDPLHLLVQNYYNNDPDAICGFCEESVQDSKWVYRCDQCDFDVHALCTKYDRTMRVEHSHPLTLVQSLSRKSRFCKLCNGDCKGYRYTCTQKSQKSCVFDLHPFCAILPEKVLCKFDNSHKLFLERKPRRFHCGRCGEVGFSCFYHCDQCDVDIHLDCMDDMAEEEEVWNEAYEKFMLECGTKDDQTKMLMITKLMDRLLFSGGFETSSSSSSRPHAVTMRVQSTIRRLSLMERPGLDALDDVNLRKKIAAETVERKAMKMAVKDARQKVKAKSLENLEKIVVDLQSSKNMSQADAEVLAVTHEKLKRSQHNLQDQKAMQVQSEVRQGPRICLFYKWKKDNNSKELLASLRADMKEVRFAFLCEEPGHEHIVHGAEMGVFHGVLGERLEKIQPFLASGLPVVTRALSTLAAQLNGLDSVTLPILGKGSWDLRAIDLEKHGKPSREPFEDEENVEGPKMSEDCAAKWLLSHFKDSTTEDNAMEDSDMEDSDMEDSDTEDSDMEDFGLDIFGWFGLLCVRYRVTEEGNFPRYRQGTLAWLCSDHLNRGAEAGTLESYVEGPKMPQMYYNPECN